MVFRQLTDYKTIVKNDLCVAQGGETGRGPCAPNHSEAGFMHKVLGNMAASTRRVASCAYSLKGSAFLEGMDSIIRKMTFISPAKVFRCFPVGVSISTWGQFVPTNTANHSCFSSSHTVRIFLFSNNCIFSISGINLGKACHALCLPCHYYGPVGSKLAVFALRGAAGWTCRYTSKK